MAPCWVSVLHCAQSSSYRKYFLRYGIYTISHFLKFPSVAVAMVIGSEYVPVPIASLALEDPVIYVHEYRQLSVLEAHMRKQFQDPVGSCRGSRRR